MSNKPELSKTDRVGRHAEELAGRFLEQACRVTNHTAAKLFTPEKSPKAAFPTATRALSKREDRMRTIRKSVRSHFPQRPDVDSYALHVHSLYNQRLISLPPCFRRSKGPRDYLEAVRNPNYRSYRKNVGRELDRVWPPNS